MRKLALILSLIMLPLHAPAQEAPVNNAGQLIEAFRPLPFRELTKQVTERYAGRIIAAGIRPPDPKERDLGVELIYEFRLLTPDRNLLNIRLDARTGQFLEVAGRGQIAARK